MKNTAQIKLIDEIGFAKTVLMPGDPLRSKMIAETFFENPVLVNNVRGVQGYTGYYKGHKISVMASGMGIPSISIYSHELFRFFGVENIIRVGTAGSLDEKIRLRDIVAGEKAYTDSAVVFQFGEDFLPVPECSRELLDAARSSAEELGIGLKTGTFYTTDLFYNPDAEANRKWSEKGCSVVEMEAAGLYINATRLGKKALAVCTVSDLPMYPDYPGCTVEEREKLFTDMIKIALETAIKIEKHK